MLTRDRGLVGRPRLQSLLVLSDNVQEQMAQVLDAFPFPADWQDTARCPEDNSVLESVDRYEVEGLMPAYVWVNAENRAEHKRRAYARTPDFPRYERFRRCSKCTRVFWPGTHWQDISRRLSALAASVRLTP